MTQSSAATTLQVDFSLDLICPWCYLGIRRLMRALANRDDVEVEAMVPPPEVIKSGVRGRPAKLVHRRVVRFGLDAPRHPGDFGLVTESGMAWLVRAREADPTIKRKKGEPDEEIILQRLMPADALRIRGRHNASNALAALALATAASTSWALANMTWPVI
mgnify:CR=1 FL=1